MQIIQVKHTALYTYAFCYTTGQLEKQGAGNGTGTGTGTGAGAGAGAGAGPERYRITSLYSYIVS